MTKEQILDDLRRQIPSFECIPGCHDCCGPVPMSKIEMKAIKGVKRNPSVSLSCPYECKKGCAIYEHRPIICRLYGAVNDPFIKCPHGFMPETVLSKVQADRIMEIYMRELVGDPLNRFTIGEELKVDADTGHILGGDL